MRHLLLASTAVLVAVSSAPAFAADLPVSDAAGLTAALATAQGNNQPDVITLAAGTYAGSFGYQDDEQLTITGAGVGQTIIEQVGTTWGLRVIGSTTSRVEDLTVSMPAGGNGATDGLRVSDVSVDDVAVVAAAGALGNGVELGGASAATDISVSGADLGRGVYIGGGGAATVDGVTVTGTSYALQSSGASSSLTVAHAHVDGARFGAAAAFSSDLTIRDSLIELGTNAGSIGLYAFDSNNPAAHDSAVVAERVTVVGAPSNTLAISTGALSAGDAMSVTARDSVFTGGANVRCYESGGGQAFVTTEYSNYVSAQDSCATGDLVETARVLGTPAFVDAAGGDYRPAAGSVLVDAADSLRDVTGVTDLDGVERPNDGNGDCAHRADVGAFERHATTPVVDADGPATGAIGEVLAFTGVGCAPEPSATLTYAWAFSDGTSETGAGVTHAFSAGGDHTATLTVTDGQGRTASDVVAVHLPEAADPDPDPDPDPVDPGATGTGTPPPSGSSGTPAPAVPAPAPLAATPAADGSSSARDLVAPRLRGVKLRGRLLRFTSSEAGTVVVTVEKRVGKRWRKAGKALRVRVRAGAGGVRLARKLRGRVRVSLVATDAAGNRSPRSRLTASLR